MNNSRKNSLSGRQTSFRERLGKQIPHKDVKKEIKDEIQEPKEQRSRRNSSSSIASSFSISAHPVVMSTPKRNTRQSATTPNSQSINRSRSILSVNDESIAKKKYHKNYDPDIELRQVNERLNKRHSTSWADQSLLNDEQDEDLQKYAEKLKKANKSLKLVTDTDVLARRQSDIDKGKVKQCYKNYVYTISKTERKDFMPRTPNKFIDMSRRAWDGMVRKWKKHIHAWNEPSPKKARLSDSVSLPVEKYRYGLPPFLVSIKGAWHNVCGNDIITFFKPSKPVAFTMNFTSTSTDGEVVVEFATEDEAHNAISKNGNVLNDCRVELLLLPIIYDYGHQELPFMDDIKPTFVYEDQNFADNSDPPIGYF